MDTMLNVNPVPKAGNKDMLFKILVIAAIVILFALILYVMFGPLPNQSNFVTKGGNNANTFNQITVVGTSTLDGGVVMKQDAEIQNDLNVEGEANLRKANFLTTSGGIDTLQGIIEPTGAGSLDIKGNNFITLKNISGTNTILSFNTNTQDGAIFGNLNINDPNGTSGLTLVNQTTSNFRYKFTNDPSTNDLIVKSSNPSGSVVKTLVDFTQDGAQVNLLDSTVAAPLVYVNGTSGAGQVYDTIYNTPPTLTSTPTFTTLTVTGATILNGSTTMNDPVTINDSATVTGNLTLSTNAAALDFSANGSGEYGQVLFGGDDGVSSRQRLLGFANGDTYLQTYTKVGIQNASGSGGVAIFDTRPNFTSGTITSAQRDTFTEPFVNFSNGYLKITLPPYTTSLVTGNQINSFTYETITASGSSPNPIFGFGSILGGWSSTQAGANGRIITPPSGVGNSVWNCPKKGIWSINFSSNYNNNTLTSSSFFLGFTRGTERIPIGLDSVNTFVVLYAGDYIFASLAEGSGILNSLYPPRLELNLIMELN